MKTGRRSWPTSRRGRNTRRKRKQRQQNSKIRFVSEFITYLLCSLTASSQAPGVPKLAAGSTFEDVLYGNDSDGEAEDDEEESTEDHKKQGNIHGGARLRIDNDQPMDLLESAVTQVTSKSNAPLPIAFNNCF